MGTQVQAIFRSSFHHNARRRLARHARFDRRPDLPGDVAIDRGMERLRLAGDDGLAVVRSLAQCRIERDFAEEWNGKLLRFGARAAMAEDLVPRAAMPADEIAHVL